MSLSSFFGPAEQQEETNNFRQLNWSHIVAHSCKATLVPRSCQALPGFGM